MSDHSETRDLNSIAVIGMSCRFPQAANYREYWKNIVSGIEPITELSDNDIMALGVNPEALARANYVKRASLLENAEKFDAGFFDFTGREASITAPVQRLTLMCAHEAIEDASYSLDTINRNVGVFIGVNRCDEWQKRLYELSSEDDGEFAKQLQLYIANDLDYAATRISYKFNLKGPSFNISTACSTSLVAIHQACRSLLSYECDMALSGGGNVVTSLDKGYLHESGGIQSSDGHCRAFDDSSSGTIFGNGIGIVLLKRLEDAVADGDYVHAIIRGTAINNDGCAKVGYTAPSVSGQTEVIATALAMAEVDAKDIGYVEAHGTGTRLGDPIEVEALTKAYRQYTPNNQYCALGSVKTNIGHLGAAAGVAGFIKAVETLKNAELAPSLHFTKANSEITFEETPFYISQASKSWPKSETPRVAALSSFGVGGTNAHAIIEEPSTRPASSYHRKTSLLLLSAKTTEALRCYNKTLGEYLSKVEDKDLCEVEYSLNTGRQKFDQRSFSVGETKDQLIDQLNTVEITENSQRFHKPADTVSEGQQYTAFLFPGQGSQYVNMARGIYHSEPVFKAAVDDCCEKLISIAGFDLRDLLFVDHNLPLEAQTQAAEKLTDTSVAQPALFVIEFALAQLLKHWGIVPDRLIGHSIGEYVAACLAQVFTLNDALTLVAGRGKLMASMPSGRMLAVELAESELSPLLEGCDIAIINGPQWCVASGTHQQIEKLETVLKNKGAQCRKVHTSHAFHSHMMDPVLEEFRALLQKVSLNEPTIPFASNVTGNWISSAQAKDPEYWVRQLRGTVQFYEGAKTLTQEGKGILIEVGPGQTLTSLIKGYKSSTQQTREIALCRQIKQQYPDTTFLLKAVGELWQAGIDFDLDAFYENNTLLRRPVPTYPFQLNQYGLTRTSKSSDTSASTLAISNTAENTSNVTLSFAEQILSSDSPLSLATDFVAINVQALFGTETVERTSALVEMGLSSLMAIEMRTLLNNAAKQDFIAVVDLLDENATIDNIGKKLLSVIKLNHTESATPQSDSALVNETASGISPALAVEAAEDTLEPAQQSIALTATNLSNKLRIEPDLASVLEPFPLTDIQQAYWIGRHSGTEGGDVATYAYLEIELKELDLQRYEASLNTLIQRHHMLRMIVQEDGQQRFLETVPHYAIPFDNLSELSEDKREHILNSLRDTMSHQILDTTVWPLFEVKINQIAENNYRLHFGFDFMIVDVLSLLVFFRDMFLIYAGEDARLDPLTLSFRDYVNFETEQKLSQGYTGSKTYWLNRIKTLPPAPQLPMTCVADSIVNPRYTRRDFTIDEPTWSRLKATAKANKITPSVVVATAYSEVLTKWCQSPDFTLNLTIFNRPNLHPQMNDLIGDFTSSVLLEVNMAETLSFIESAKRVQNRLMTDLEHRQFNGVEVLRALNSQSGSYQSVVMPIVLTSALGLDQYSETKLLGISEEKMALYHEMMNLGHTISQTSQVWLDHVVREKDGILHCNWDALEQLFPPGVLDEMFTAYYDRLIELANNGDHAWHSLRDTELPLEQSLRRDQVNATSKVQDQRQLSEIFDEAVAAFPNNLAIINRGKNISYQQLQNIGLRLSTKILSSKHAPKRNELVAIVMDKGWEQIASVFGVLYAGAAYLPVDASQPNERIDQIIEEGEAKIVLTQGHLVETRVWPQGVEVIVLDDELLHAATIALKPSEIQRSSTTNCRDLAYVLFTSGSTGKPKGVMVSHHAVVNTVLDINERFDITETDRLIAINALNFDLSVYDIFGGLSCGAALVMPEYTRALDVTHWLDLVAEYKVSVWNTVPAIVQLFIDEIETLDADTRQKRCLSLRFFMMSGDWIPVELARRIQQALSSVKAISLGGPTESTVWSIFYPIENIGDSWKSVPYGKPLSNRQHLICHENYTDCPEWVTGEILTGGPVGLADGYWRDEERTQRLFITHPQTGERFYKTGDLGKFLPDGNIEFVGRKDFQVKIQGHRIELGEIEHQLEKCEGVKRAVALALTDASNTTQAKNTLLAFVEQEKDDSLAEFLNDPKILTNPTDIALFKMEQHGINQFESNNVIPLVNKPREGKSIALTSVTLHHIFKGAETTTDQPVSQTAFGEWLACMAQVPIEGYSLPKYFYPSAGSAHSVQLYFAIDDGALQNADQGIYYYNPIDHALQQVSHHAGTTLNVKDILADRKLVAFFVLYKPAVESLYGQVGVDRLAILEAGHMAYLLAAAAPNAGITLGSVTAIQSEQLIEHLQLNNDYSVIQALDVAPSNTHQPGLEKVKPLNAVARQSYRTFNSNVVSADNFSALLGQWKTQTAEISHELDRSIQVFLYIKHQAIDSTEGGFYTFDFVNGNLTLLTAVDPHQPPKNFQYARNAKIHRESAFTIIVTAKKDALLAHGRRSLLCTGFLAQALQNVCTDLGIGICCTAGAKQQVAEHCFPITSSDDIIYCLEAGSISKSQTETWVTEGMQDHSEEKELELRCKQYLQAKLPYYMVPSRVVSLDALPLNHNGKINRKALENMAFSDTDEHIEHAEIVAPIDDIETALVEIWKTILSVDEISTHGNLFELGGDSLVATKLISETNRQLEVTLSLHKLFADPTIVGLAKEVRTQLQSQSTDESSTASASELLMDFREAVELMKQDSLLNDTVCPPSLEECAPVADTQKLIFLTGATGFLGAYVLAELLNTTQADICCLSRPHGGQAASGRVYENLKKYGIWKDTFLDRITCVEGDLSQPKLGFSESTFEHLSQNVDAIFHVGAQVNYARSYQDIRDTNVTGMNSVISLATQRKIKPITVISTKYVCFALSEEGEKHYPAEAPVDDAEGMFIGYTQSKWVVEKLAEQAATRGVPVRIVRPGQITAAAQGSLEMPMDAFHHLLRLFRQVQTIPNGSDWQDGVIDVIPVDLAAQSIVKIATAPVETLQYFNLVNPKPLSISDFFGFIDASCEGEKPFVSFDQWSSDCTSAISNMEDRTAAFVIERFFITTEHGQFIQGMFRNGYFTTANTEAVIDKNSLSAIVDHQTIWNRYLAQLIEEGRVEKPKELLM